MAHHYSKFSNLIHIHLVGLYRLLKSGHLLSGQPVCAGCSGCTGCADCADCANCTGCSGCAICAGCTSCADFAGCAGSVSNASCTGRCKLVFHYHLIAPFIIMIYQTIKPNL